jgi:hypothetical protein
MIESTADRPAGGGPGAAPAVYVYGVVGGRPVGVFGGGGVGTPPSPVRMVEGADLTAIVSDVPGAWRAAGRADVERHDRILARLGQAQTVIPLRFGTIMASDTEVREHLLEGHAAQLGALVARLGGRVQMSVKAYYLDQALLRAVLARHPQLKRRSDALEGMPVAATQPQRIALGQEVAAAVEEQRERDQRELLAPLAELAEEFRLDAPASERQAFSVQLLVEERRRPRLDAAVQRLTGAHRQRFAFRYVGPIPPYSFCDLELDPGGG